MSSPSLTSRRVGPRPGEVTPGASGQAAVAGPVGDRPAGRAPSLRFTRRGRVVMLVVLSALLLAAFSVGRVSSRAAGPDRPASPAPTVVVHAGDTLWSIARRSAPDVDPRLVVDRIVEANHLTSSTVRVGQRLVVPGD